MIQSILVLAGPTASGKTSIAVDLARRFDAEIISADSRQIYAGMPIGTAAPTPEELAAAPHHLVGFLEPHRRYSAALFRHEAEALISEIVARGKRVIVAGGTGFYIRALTAETTLAPEYDSALRLRLAEESRTHPSEFLHEWLGLLAPERASVLPKSDTYRILRALEIALASRKGAASGKHESGNSQLERYAARSWPYLKLVLDIPLPELDARIAKRTQRMLEDGLVQEAERIGPTAVAASAVGYPQSLAFLSGQCTREELRAILGRATRRYARRQYTWFRSEPNATWVHPVQIESTVMERLGWRKKVRR